MAKGSILFSKSAPPDRRDVRVMVNGAPGLVVFLDGKPASILGFTIVGDHIVESDILADAARLARFDLSAL